MSIAPSRALKGAVPLAIAVALVCGIGGRYFAKHVVGAIGRATDHTEPVLRALGWAAGVLAVFAAGLLTVIGILVLQKLLGPPDKKQLTIFGRALGAGWLILTAAGLAYALVGPLP